MNEPRLKPRIAAGLIWRTFDDDAVVVSPQIGAVQVLNSIGTVIWQLLSEEKELSQIEAHLVNRYEVSPDQARHDLHAFLRELADHELLTWEP
jgi:hypothetical protein